MNRDDLNRMASEAGLGGVENWQAVDALIQAAYAAGAAAEREACAKVLDEMAAQDKLTNYYGVAANAIRARGQA